MLLFTKKEIDYYLGILVNSKSSRTIKNGLQSLFFELQQGKFIDQYNSLSFGKILEEFIKENKDERIRLWSYKIGCFLNCKNIVYAAIEKVKYELNPENIMWVVSLASVHIHQDKEFLNFLIKNIHSLSFIHVKLACYLFGNRFDLKKEDLIKLGNSSDKIILTWLETIYAYNNIAIYYNHEGGVDRELIEDFTMHHDNDISKYAVGALWKQGDFLVERVKIDYRDHEKLDEKTKKWFYTSIWQDKNFIVNNNDYINHILSKYYLIHKCTEKVKEGLARGISSYWYNPSIVNRILEWYINEENEVVKIFLVKYMTKWKNFNDDYRQMVSLEEIKGDNETRECIRFYQKVLEKNGGENMKVFIGSSKEASDDMDRLALIIEKLGHSCVPWTDSTVFVAGENTLESLADLANKVDAAIFVFNAEDEVWYRGDKHLAVRDNVLLEYGIFLGAKGRKNAIFACKNSPKIATDLLGIHHLDLSDGNATLKLKLKTWLDSLRNVSLLN